MSIFAENLGFSVWVLWTIVVLNLGNVGITLSLSELFWLTAVPNLVGAFLRIPYTFAVPRFGGRLWTAHQREPAADSRACCSRSSCRAAGSPGSSHDTQFWVLLACAATAGFGGGNFSSSMANVSFFYPEGKKGLALGLNAAGGNLGVAVAQLVVPLVIIVGVPAAAVKLPEHEVHLAYAGLMWMPFIVVAAIGAWLYMDSLTQAKADTRAYAKALGHGQTWVMSLLYIGTFGSFIGYSFALPLVIKNTFPEFLAGHPFIATYLAGLGFVGALSARSRGRSAAGCRTGSAAPGSRSWCFVGMAAFTRSRSSACSEHSFALFFGAYMVDLPAGRHGQRVDVPDDPVDLR